MLDTNIFKMAENDLNDPDKDYGLPKVEIKPLAQSTGTIPLEIKPQEPKSIEVKPDEMASIEVPPIMEVPKEQLPEKEDSQEPAPQKLTPLVEAPKEVAFQNSSEAKDEPANIPAGERKKAADKEEAKNRSFAWIWIVVVLGLGVGAWALYKNFQGQTEEEPKPIAETVEETLPVTPAPPVEEEIEEPVQEIGLTEIRAREETPRFFVVVGSFNNEAMAKNFSENLHQKEMNTFLVYPYGDISNYRLAIAHFPSFDQAMNELNRVKGDFKEDLWVLKY